MQIELSEILTCPDCRSPQGLIVLVDELDDEGRVRDGDLGCSRCQRRYPIRDGVVDLLGGGGSGEPERVAEGDGGRPSPRELAAEIGGLLDLRSASGPVVLGHGLAPAAGPLAGLLEGVSLLALAEEAGDGAADSWTLVLAPAGRLPLLPGKAEGVALWKPGAGALEDARRALSPGGRLALLRPDEDARRDLEGSGLEVLASEERAAVARRSG
ncbi:MAG: Trm112 family protein [Candidatus Palauibacterales bacterium]|nr:Trm112 family protein [Candidatus Palauibacterales bacterium]